MKMIYWSRFNPESSSDLETGLFSYGYLQKFLYCLTMTELILGFATIQEKMRIAIIIDDPILE